MKTSQFFNSILSVGGLLLASAFGSTAFAQTATQDQSTPSAASQPAPRMHEHPGDRFAGLNLTDDQKAQMKKIHEDARAKADAVKADSSLSDTDKQAKMKEIHRDAKKQAQAVLTPDQRKQLKAKMRERRAERSKNQPS
jgi:Spy/CpxP family protein refolding chaperone